MRLICPGCDAQYDVSDNAIPPAGREVQCSFCTHTWFEIATLGADAPAASDMPEEAAPVVAAADQSAPIPPEVALPAAPAPQNIRRTVDESVKAILQQEAARDKTVVTPPLRVAPTAVVPPTAPLADVEQTRKLIAQAAITAGAGLAPLVASNTPTGNASAPAVTQPARDMPSMEDINTSLRARSETGHSSRTPTEYQQSVNRRGFRRGFSVMVLLFAIALAPYLLAPQIVAAVPQLADAVTVYVGSVDQLRVMLQTNVATFADWISGLTAAG